MPMASSAPRHLLNQSGVGCLSLHCRAPFPIDFIGRKINETEEGTNSSDSIHHDNDPNTHLAAFPVVFVEITNPTSRSGTYMNGNLDQAEYGPLTSALNSLEPAAPSLSPTLIVGLPNSPLGVQELDLMPRSDVEEHISPESVKPTGDQVQTLILRSSLPGAASHPWSIQQIAKLGLRILKIRSAWMRGQIMNHSPCKSHIFHSRRMLLSALPAIPTLRNPSYRLCLCRALSFRHLRWNCRVSYRTSRYT